MQPLDPPMPHACKLARNLCLLGPVGAVPALPWTRHAAVIAAASRIPAWVSMPSCWRTPQAQGPGGAAAGCTTYDRADYASWTLGKPGRSPPTTRCPASRGIDRADYATSPAAFTGHFRRATCAQPWPRPGILISRSEQLTRMVPSDAGLLWPRMSLVYPGHWKA